MRGRWRLAAALAAAVVAGGCTGGPVHPAPSAPGVASPVHSTLAFPRVVLTADLSERPARWTLVATIPFGERESDLRYVPAHEAPTIEPSSFAVAPDGSLWIIDQANKRLAHYSSSGSYLGQVVGDFSSFSRDLAFDGGDLWVIEHSQFGRLFRLDPEGGSDVRTVDSEAQPVFLIDLISASDGLYSELGGFVVTPTPPPVGPVGLYRLGLSAGPGITSAHGLPIPGSRTIWASTSGDADIDVTTTSAEGDRVQPIHVRILDRALSPGRALEGAVGPGSFVVQGEDLAMYVRIVAQPGEGAHAIGGRYLLRVGSSPLLWERLPDPTRDDDRQERFLAGGPDGALYLMVTDRDAVRIFRRP